jgi:CHASE2 domain-containing sensor protein
MIRRAHPWKERLRRYRHLIPMVLILLVLTVPELEKAWTWDPCALQQMDQDIFTTLLYRPLANWVLHFKSTQDPTVVIVYIDPATEPPELLTNTCLARVFLASLVDDISTLGAKAIVIDKFYSDTSCTDPASNETFKTAMTNKTIPIVVGAPTHLLTDKKGTEKGCLALSNKFDFGGQKVKYGLTRLNSDVLKLPLQWPVFLDTDDPTVNSPRNDPPDIGDTLSLVAARQIDPSVDTPGPVKNLITAKVHPYTNFLELSSTNAMTVRCSTEPDPPDADNKEFNCSKMKWPSHSLGDQKLDLAGKIVVIGDLSDQDMQPFPDEKKERPGVYLQANYIQSILDRRFLQEIPLYLTLIGLTLFIVSIYCLHLFLDSRRALQVSLVMLAVVLLFSIVALLTWSYFTPLWALWTATIVVAVRFLETKAHHLSTEVMHDASHTPHGGKR